MHWADIANLRALVDFERKKSKEKAMTNDKVCAQFGVEKPQVT